MRTDISKYLFHGVRKPNKEDYPIDRQKDYLTFVDENNLIDEFDVLKNIINEGALRSGFSYRKGNPTIYGDSAVVCFTEMPLLNIIQYAQQHKENPKISTYGIAILKPELFKLGGRPVISGLTGEVKFENGNNRKLNESILPLNEQYRYVYLNLNDRNIDWTHEREWRIKANDELFVENTYNESYYKITGLNIFDKDNFSECIIIVKTKDEADELSLIVEHQLDMCKGYGSHDFSTNLRFLILDEAVKTMDKNKDITSIEKMPKSAYFNYNVESLTEDEKKNIVKVVEDCKILAKTYANIYIEENSDKLIGGCGFKDICGFAYVRTFRVRNKYVRFLIENDYMYASVDGTYTFKNLNDNIPHLQGLTYHEFIALKQCEFLNKKIDNLFTIDSIWD